MVEPKPETEKPLDVKKPSTPVKVIHTYKFKADNVPVGIEIVRDPRELVLLYRMDLPEVGKITKMIMEDIKQKLTQALPLQLEVEIVEKEKFLIRARELLVQSLPHLPEHEILMLSGFLYHQMLGLGELELMIKDDQLEEVAVINSKEPVWVYHRQYGWMKSNLRIDSEDKIQNLSSIIARKVGRRITTLTPLLDAHIETGDRINATLAPITTKGNTLTIRKMRRRPWLVNDLIENKTINSEVMALLWMAMQYELSILVAGGTASGKTTFLNMLLPFIQPNHRIVSIEDTRELNLPKFMHWIPTVIRLASPEGKGQISMLDLLVNSMRMRPDRIVVGEVRRRREAEVLFEAMHTGHSVYSTIHADTAEQTVRRLTTPPIDLPESELEALPLIVVCFRQRRLGIRRIFQVSELVPSYRVGKEEKLNVNTLYRWRPRTDDIVPVEHSVRIFEQLQNYTGLVESEIKQDLQEKQGILDWITKHKLPDLETQGIILSLYYWDRETLLEAVKKGKNPKELLPAA